jgi:hypothetical protein
LRTRRFGAAGGGVCGAVGAGSAAGVGTGSLGGVGSSGGVPVSVMV